MTPSQTTLLRVLYLVAVMVWLSYREHGLHVRHARHDALDLHQVPDVRRTNLRET